MRNKSSDVLAMVHQTMRGLQRASVIEPGKTKAKVKSNPHRGSTLDEFLEGQGARGELEGRAVKEVIAWQRQEAMKVRAISKATMTSMMNTSRTQLDRLLDPTRDVRLSTLARAAAIVGRQIRVELT